MKDIYVKIEGFALEQCFPNKDIVTIAEIILKLEDALCEIEVLKEKLEPEEEQIDPYDVWVDKQW